VVGSLLSQLIAIVPTVVNPRVQVAVTAVTITSLFKNVAARFLDASLFDEWASMIILDEEKAKTDLNIAMLTEAESRVELQTSMILNALLEALRVKDNIQNARKMIDHMDRVLIKPKNVLSATFSMELQTLHTIANVESPTADLAAVKEAKDTALANANLKLQQALLKFPTGRDLCDAVDIEEIAALKDVHTLKALEAVETSRLTLSTGKDCFVHDVGVVQFSATHVQRLVCKVAIAMKRSPPVSNGHSFGSCM
jgi:hypothetical protein